MQDSIQQKNLHQRIDVGKVSPQVYNQRHLLDRIIKKPITKLVETIGCYSMFLQSPPFDKVFCHFDVPFDVKAIEHLINEYKTGKLHRLKRKAFVPTSKYSFVFGRNDIQITLFSNSIEAELQFNAKKNSNEFICNVTGLFFPGQRARLARLDLSFDIRKAFSYIKENLRILSKRSVRCLTEIPHVLTIDPKAGPTFSYPSGTEYHGKKREIAIYNSGNFHGLGEDISRIEIRYKVMRVMPVKYFDELSLLKSKKLFSDLRLPMKICMAALTKTERKYLQELRVIAKRECCSPSLALKLVRSESMAGNSKADSMSRVLRKIELNHFDFDSAFNQNLELFLNSKMSAEEREFLDELTSSLKSVGGSTLSV